ncbi:MAG: hypothetical protein C4575_06695 [Desulforudis sp.]|jgi:murein L,D-transpeptidase YafK|nr:MAG: hypothetical protein C4575_06695 [Desulforudis sp.]
MKYRIPVYLVIILALLVVKKYGWPPNFHPKTVDDIVATYSVNVRSALSPLFQQQNIAYPPERLRLVANKSARILSLYVAKENGWARIKEYPFTASSGALGPKLKEGDGQIPEGIYGIEYLNPNSSYHLSMKLNYPNQFDQEMAKRDHRSRIGGDIFIHGSDVTIGCIPIGDRNIEELFVLTALAGKDNVEVIITPYDLTSSEQREVRNKPAWADELYDTIRLELQQMQETLMNSKVSMSRRRWAS